MSNSKCLKSTKNMSLFQIYLLTAVPLFSVPQLSSSPAVNHLIILSLPHLLPVAHIGMVGLYRQHCRISNCSSFGLTWTNTENEEACPVFIKPINLLPCIFEILLLIEFVIEIEKSCIRERITRLQVLV